MKKINIIILALILLVVVIIVPDGNVDATGDGITINVYIVTDGNLNDTINATMNDSINNWVNGLVINNEVVDIWKVYNKISGRFSFINSLATSALKKSNENEEKLEEQNQAINFHSDLIDDTKERVYFLGNEVLIFKEDYQYFENKTDSALDTHEEHLQLQNDEINNLKVKVSDLTGILMLIRNAFICLIVTVAAILIINIKYPIKKLVRNSGIVLKTNILQMRKIKIIKNNKLTLTSILLKFNMSENKNNRKKQKTERSIQKQETQPSNFFGLSHKQKKRKPRNHIPAVKKAYKFLAGNTSGKLKTIVEKKHFKKSVKLSQKSEKNEMPKDRKPILLINLGKHKLYFNNKHLQKKIALDKNTKKKPRNHIPAVKKAYRFLAENTRGKLKTIVEKKHFKKSVKLSQKSEKNEMPKDRKPILLINLGKHKLYFNNKHLQKKISLDKNTEQITINPQ